MAKLDYCDSCTDYLEVEYYSATDNYHCHDCKEDSIG